MGKTANQTSTAHEGFASRAVDGNSEPRFGLESCTHTYNEVNPWWAVDLEESVTIARVEITNRNIVGKFT